jgi:predicted nucleotidyltransferase
MANNLRPSDLTQRLREFLQDVKGISFAYLYGSAAYDPPPPGGDIDIAVYLKPSDMGEYIKKEDELTTLLISKLGTDDIDLRILNVLPLVLQHSILKEGILILSRDETERVEFETSVMIRFFELKPYLEEYRTMLSERIRGVQ